MKPFDETLKGYPDTLTINPSTLSFPMMVFPQGSFFPNGTYGLNTSTNKLLRPGIDFVFLSLNENITYSDNLIIDSKMKNNFICNVVLYKKQINSDVKWTIAYTGGEDDDRPNRYANELNRLHNLASENGTVDNFITPKQGYGNFVSMDNSQIITAPFQHIIKGHENKFEALALSVSCLAQTVTTGGDPLLIDAFEQWVRNSSLVLNSQAEVLMAKSSEVINSNNNIRVSDEQFIHTDSTTLPTNQNFLEHKNIILRGLDTNQKVGFFGLASGGNNIVSQTTHIFQKKSNPTAFDNDTYLFFSNSMVADTINIKVKTRVSSSKQTKLYVVSKNLRKTILEADVSFLYSSTGLNEKQYKLNYPIGKYTFDTDTLFAYVVNNDGFNDFKTTALKDITINNVSYGYSMSISNNGKVVSVDNSANSTRSVEVILKRAKSDYAQNTNLKCVYDNSNQEVTINGVTSINLDWDVDEKEKRLLINLKEDLNNSSNAIVFKHMNNGIVLSSMVVGLKNSQNTPFAFIQVVNSLNDSSLAFGLNYGTPHYLVVTHSQNNVDYKDNLKINLTKLNNQDIDFDLGSPIKLSDVKYAYPIRFKGGVNTLFNINVTDMLNKLVTNTLELVITSDMNLGTYKLVFAYLNAGWDYRQIKKDDKYILEIDLPLNGNYPDGLMYDLECSKSEISIPKFAVTKNNRISFVAYSDVKILDAISFSFIRNSNRYNAFLNMSDLNTIDFRIQYQNGEVSRNKLSLNQPMKMEVVNNFSTKTVKFTKSSYNNQLKIKGISFNKPFSNEVVLAPGEVKTITNNDWVELNSFSSDLETGGNYGRYCPDYDVVIYNQDGSVYKAGNAYNFLQQIFVPKTDTSVTYYNVANRSLAVNKEVENNVEVKVTLPQGVHADNIYLKDLASNWGYELVNTYLNSDKNSLIAIVRLRPNFFKQAVIPETVSFTLGITDNTINTTYDQFITMRVI